LVAQGAGIAAGAAAYLLLGRNKASPAAASPEEGKKRMVRRHSSGDHAFLPTKKDRDAINQSQRSFGVRKGDIQDSEVRPLHSSGCAALFPPPFCTCSTARDALATQGSQLPTTRGY